VTKRQILRSTFFVVGICLSLAWLGAISAAEQKIVQSDEVSELDEELVLLKSDAESLVVELRTPSYEVGELSVDGVVYHVLGAPGCGQTDEVGQPQLPVRGTFLGIPMEAEYTLYVLEAEQETVPGKYNVYPVPRPVVKGDGDEEAAFLGYEFARDETVYTSAALYPGYLAEVGTGGLLRDVRVVRLRFSPFQYDPSTGELKHYRRIRVELRFSYPRGQSLLGAAHAEDDSFQEVYQSALLNYDSAREWRSRPVATSSLRVPVLGQGESSFKVVVDEEGIYQVTYADLQGAGMDLGSVSPLDFELYNQGEELAFHVADEDDNGLFDEDDYLLFYGQPVSSTYTEENVYWLTKSISDGLRMVEKDGTLGASTVPTYFNTTARGEDVTFYHSRVPVPDTIPSDEELDHWFAGSVRAPGSQTTADFFVELENLTTAAPPYSATLRGVLVGVNSGKATGPYSHKAKVYLNGQLVHEALWSGEAEYLFEESDIPHTDLAQGSNMVTVECLLDNPTVAPEDLVRVNWFEIDYRRTYTAENDLLFFDGDGAGTWQYEVGEFLTNTIEVFDVTNPLSVARFVNKTVEETGSYTVKFRDAISEERHYLALTPSQYKSPLEIVEDSVSDLRSTANEADYLIITHPDFVDAVSPLKNHRQTQGLDVMVIDVVDIYDEFNHGILHPHAIRDFLRYAYENWATPAPSYVLLVGDANYDFKDYLGYGEPTYVPPYLLYADVWKGEGACDNRLVCVSGDDELPDMHIGRWSAQTVAQVTAMSNKTIAYETSLPAGGWRQEVLFVADDPDDPGDPDSPNHFWSLSDDVADHHVPPSPLFTTERVYFQVSPYTTVDSVTDAILDAFETGRLFFNYVGHASATMWGGYPYEPFFWTWYDLDDVPPSNKTPIMLVMACNDGDFIMPPYYGYDMSCIAESLVRAQGKGAVAGWSPASFGTSSGQHYLHTGFYDAVFRDGVSELGPATQLGKLNLYQNAGGDHRELIDTYMVFGDPALQFPIERTYMSFLPVGLKRY
jgi:hypothetical protein